MQNSELNSWPESGNNNEEWAENNYYAAPSGIYTEAEKMKILESEIFIEKMLNNPDPMEVEGRGCDIYVEVNDTTASLVQNLQKYKI